MKTTISFRLNGLAVETEVDLRESLLELLRRLGATGAKLGCGMGECGACAVLLDDTPVDSCIFLAVWAKGADVRTIEGEAEDGLLSAVQKAYVDAGAVQCGFCTPGLVMTTTAFVRRHKGQPVTEELIRREHAGHLCRCTGFETIVRAVELSLAAVPDQAACACRRTLPDHA